MLSYRSVWRKRLILALILTLVGGGMALGDGRLPEDRGATGLWRTLLELRTTASALHITAHPDDEDGPSLTLLARGQGVHTMLLSLNRGEGGANLIAPFFFDALGVLRTLELLQSARYYGVDLFFTHVVDYGFSKTLDEALTKWGGEEAVLRAVVRVVRRERPDIIIARFRGTPRDGHGHHQAAGLVAQQAFDAAANPHRFPEQIAEGLRPWRPKKLYMNNIRPAWRPEDKELVTLVVEAGVYDPLLGRSYAQISREGLGYQRSQGTTKRARPAGTYRRYYQLVKTALPAYSAQREDSFFDGMDTSIPGIAQLAGAQAPPWLSTGLSQIHTAVEAAVSKFDARAPEKTVSSLVAGLTATRKLLEQVERSSLVVNAKDQIQFLLARKAKQFQKALRLALGLDVEVAVDPDVLPTGPFAAFTTAPTLNHAIPGQPQRRGSDPIPGGVEGTFRLACHGFPGRQSAIAGQRGNDGAFQRASRRQRQAHAPLLAP
jgi:LmbE family N-acetylglucosaminyl deacetylase